ncbi:helix-turn-helix domain-containing protein [Streptomyces zagrosensis]|uniref:Transcriptional regulator with XRE-family HTH domain n=1 Tax=Streptomyces zagrosensis TaxID=1042984 RepID=A0A7W9V0P3_9ACTN|nr:helix-turn-helix transcriptional regulator [Streptomyces zagrosensis]MBB5938325.1 transcriptional regulator with XRE-family HTH domain [Streptomyces zagrosensis]
MPPRSSPTYRQQRLGSELRKLRERAGLSMHEAASMLGVDRAKMSSIETGRVGLSAARVRSLTCHYDCADQDLIAALTAMTGDRARYWWDEYRGVLPSGFQDLAELEHHAVKMRTAQVASLPGLFQTVDHARANFGQGRPPLPPHELEHRVSHRMKRQAVLHQDPPIEYTAIIHEAALRMRFGGKATARAQLEYILTMSERDSITVLALPFEAGAFPGSGQTIFYAHGPVAQLDTVQLDESHGALFVDAPTQLDKYRDVLDGLEALALGPAESRTFIRDIAQSL